MRIARPISRLMSAAALLCAAATAAAQTQAKPAPGNAAARGQYLVAIMSCNDCHTPFKMGAKGPEPDMKRMLSGFPETSKLPPPPAPAGPWIWSGTGDNTAFAGPWGITYAANLTPDKNTGLGIWTEDMFVKALKTGKHMGTSREIQPPMPWPWIGKATDEDLKAIYAYLKSIPPISNHVPDWAPPTTAAGSPATPASGAGPKKR
ncbi:MAG: diheme cytochrome c-553 [Acidobacteriota bacterium]|nr:diheme cytochrome c-553 [Acidobacteriota bacterium]